MKSGYKIIWTDFASDELANTFIYLENDFSEKHVINLANEIERIINLISENPLLFVKVYDQEIRRVAILKYNNLNYKINEDSVEIISFFSNRQSPEKQKLNK